MKPNQLKVFMRVLWASISLILSLKSSLDDGNNHAMMVYSEANGTIRNRLKAEILDAKVIVMTKSAPRLLDTN
jgi:hypothetical protein